MSGGLKLLLCLRPPSNGVKGGSSYTEERTGGPAGRGRDDWLTVTCLSRALLCETHNDQSVSWIEHDERTIPIVETFPPSASIPFPQLGKRARHHIWDPVRSTPLTSYDPGAEDAPSGRRQDSPSGEQVISPAKPDCRGQFNDASLLSPQTAKTQPLRF